MGSSSEVKFNVEDLRKNCNELFKVSVEIFDGALYGIEQISKEDAEKKIENWLERRVD